ncbi:TPA: metallopeptidase family protein [Candidatus Saccharibacteria bacterium]|nr:metallopeptidase family protein [Candidatus Saccharibacteria bacterium]HIO87330.1 metallopeptidase family protein [Candidatus Saccharibacteria bacterium]
MDDELFEKFIAEGIDAIPAQFGDAMENVAVVAQDEPTPAQIHKLKLRPWSLLFGLYEGVPKTKRRNSPYQLPDKITIFKNPILRISATEEDVRQKVIETVWHEVGHHFGLSDEQIYKLQEKPNS